MDNYRTPKSMCDTCPYLQEASGDAMKQPECFYFKGLSINEGKSMCDKIRLQQIHGSITNQLLNEILNGKSNLPTLKELNLMLIKTCLDVYEQNPLKVAKVLGLGKSTLYRIVQEIHKEKWHGKGKKR